MMPLVTVAILLLLTVLILAGPPLERLVDLVLRLNRHQQHSGQNRR
jgi:hypothetical protein